jgi:predicted CXXCH cytochrome family protein
MSFLIRQISRTSDGREIIRAYPHDVREIIIGREASCEIHLADLAVELRHARLTLQANGKLDVVALAGNGFEVDGSKTSQAVIDPAGGSELRFGSHLLVISVEDGVVVITAERIEVLSDATQEKDEIGLFTLRSIMPSRRLMAWALSIIILLALLVWPIHTFYNYQNAEKRPAAFHADSLWSSGSLSSSHAGLGMDCQSCHTEAFVAVPDSSCVACHEDVHDHADPKRLILAKAPLNWDGKMSRKIAESFSRPEGRCVECHTEHEGAGPMEDTKQQFCSSCHTDMNKRLTDTKIANAGDFGTAHPQFKPEVITANGSPPTRERISLDQKPVEDSGLKFPHDVHLSRTNGVARMAGGMGKQFGFGQALDCKDCHVKTPDGIQFKPIDMEQSCAMCHSLGIEKIGDTVRTLRHGDPKMVVADIRAFYRAGGPYRVRTQQVMEGRKRPGDYARSQPYYAYFGSVNYSRADSAIRSVFSKGGACYDCHTVIAPPAGSDNWQVQKVHQTSRFMMKGWFDHAAHDTETCSSCHAAKKSGNASELLLPGIKTCRTCHGGEASNADVPSSCAMCHSFHADDGAPWVPKFDMTRKRDVSKTRVENNKVRT